MSEFPSIIDRLAAQIPSLEAKWANYRSGSGATRDKPSVQAVFLANHVCDYLAAGKAAELGPFFIALDEAYRTRLSEDESLALYEGFMEDFISSLEEHGIDPRRAYDQLGPEARLVWQGCWRYAREGPWDEAAGA